MAGVAPDFRANFIGWSPRDQRTDVILYGIVFTLAAEVLQQPRPNYVIARVPRRLGELFGGSVRASSGRRLGSSPKLQSDHLVGLKSAQLLSCVSVWGGVCCVFRSSKACKDGFSLTGLSGQHTVLIFYHVSDPSERAHNGSSHPRQTEVQFLPWHSALAHRLATSI